VTFYLDYRPKKIDEIDLTEARQALKRILSSAPFPHALLLAGPRGIGKTSAARIIAKSLNCQKKKPDSIDPCNRCSSCLAIDKGAFLDVLEIDAASNRGIDDIRQLKEGIGLAPVKGKNKVYIIDEVHMLTNEAFNALLKTLEEPPERVVFILCTTNPEKIPQTVLSRCLRINFSKASDKEVIRSLKRVVKKENLKLENDQVLDLIAQNVDGSFRDGQKILEELSFGKEEITLESTSKVVGSQADLGPSQLLIFLGQGDLSLALEEVARLEENGVDWVPYLKRLLALLRRLLHGVWGLPDGEKSGFSAEQLIFWVKIFSQTANEIKNASLPVLLVELAVASAVDQNKETERGEREEKNPSFTDKIEPTKASPILKKTKEVQKTGSKKKTGRTSKKKDKPASKVKKTLTEEQWQSLLEKIKPKNHSLEAFLKTAYPISFENKRLILGVYYQFHKECLEKEANRRIVEAVAEEVLNCKVSLFYRLSKKKTTSVKKDNRISPKSSNDGNIYHVAKEIFGGDDQ